MSRWDKSRTDAIYTGIAAGIVGLAVGFFTGGTGWVWSAIEFGAVATLIGGAIGGTYGAITGGGKDSTPSQASYAATNARSAQLSPSQEAAIEQEQETTKFRDMVTQSRGSQQLGR